MTVFLKALVSIHSNGREHVSPDGKWAVVIFAARESSGVLIKTLKAAANSVGPSGQIELVVNGNPSLAREIVSRILFLQNASSQDASPIPILKLQLFSVPVNVWEVEFGDKANAWNQYIHSIWCGERLAFFVDGYVVLNPNAIAELGQITLGDPYAIAGTGVPTQGGSAKAVRDELLERGGLHGNFCCLKGATMQEMKSRNIRLPLALYRVDSLMGALLGLGFDPERQEWQKERIAIAKEASWTTGRWSWSNINDVKSQFKRLLRQFRGGFEKRAFRHYLEVQKGSPEMLPESSPQMVTNYLRSRQFGWLAIRLYLLFNPFERVNMPDQLPRLKWSGHLSVVGPTLR